MASSLIDGAGMAVRLVTDLGLHKVECLHLQAEDLPQEEITLRSNVFWAVYCIDT
jgi:hypothetical protein